MARDTETEILVVDDTIASLDLLTEILRSEGYKVRPASDGELALRSVRSKLPSLILLDIRMPGIDGYEVCRLLKADEQTRDIPVIFLSSLSDTADKVRGFELGAVDYISKPYNKEELLARVRTHIELYELKNSLEALVEERTEKLSIVADYASDWEYWLGAHGCYEYVSPSCEKITGYSADEFYADPDLMLKIIVHTDDKVWFARHLDAIKHQKEGCASKEIQILTKDGQTRYIEHNCKSIYKNSIWLGQRGSNRDITERKRAEESSHQSEKKFQILFEAAPVSLAIADDSGHIKFTNNSFKKIFGYSLDDIPTIDDWYALAYPDEEYRSKVGKIWGDAVQKAIRNNEIVEPFEYKVKCKNGDEKIVEISGISIGNNFLASFFDITQIKEAQEVLKRSNDLLEDRVKEELEKSRQKDYLLIKQSRLAAMGEMIGAIAHQWRQPLNSLGLAVQDVHAAYKYGELNEEYILKFHKDTMAIIQRMSKTIDDFRNYFRVNKEVAEFSLEEAVEQTLALVQAQLTNNYITVDFHKDGRHLVYGYKNETEQVILIIISNAKDALLDNKIVEPKINISINTDEEEKTRLVIEDNGGGLAEDVIDKIFEPYFTTKEQGKGIGIGLYMAKEIINRQMHGEIRVENTDVGAKFTIVFGKMEASASPSLAGSFSA